MILVSDIGGTSMRIALGDGAGVLSEEHIVDTPQDVDEAVRTFTEIARSLSGFESATCAVVGIASVLDEHKSVLEWPPHLPGWKGSNLREALREALGLPVYLENDAALAALGEARLGAGRGASILAYVTVGTGIGGARIVDGHIDRAVRGFEIGHQYISLEEGGQELEGLVSGSAVLKRFGKRASEVRDPQIWKKYAHLFAYGLYNTLLHWSPDRVVLGGSLFHGIGMTIPDIETALQKINRVLPRLPEIRVAELEYPGLVGALVYGNDLTTHAYE